MENGFIEREQQLRLIIVAAPNDPPLSSTKYQRELREFSEALRFAGFEVSSRLYIYDSTSGGGVLSGEFIIAVAALTTLLSQARKLIETLLDARQGRKVKLQIGALKIEGGARDVEKVLAELTSSEEFKKLLASETLKKKTSHARSA